MCGIQNKSNEPVNIFSEDDFDHIIDAITAGIITVDSLDYRTYKKIAEFLTKGLYKGFGSELSELSVGTVDYDMLFELRTNVWIFSGAKTYQQTRELVSLLTKGDEITDFNSFREKAKEILIQYNENYLRTEYNTCIGNSQNASRWLDFEKDKHLYPNLTYHTVGDSRVRETHRALEGITKPVGDPFWKTYAPMNGWNCRCILLQSDAEAKITDTKDFKHPDDVPDIFMFNPGTEKIVFSPKHPYFDIAPKDKQNAKQNWGFPLH